LIEELVEADQCLLRQHNLIRGIALEDLRNLDTNEITDVATISSAEENRFLPGRLELEEIGLEEIFSGSQSSFVGRMHYCAVVNWLTKYQPESSSTNIERVRGYLEAFYHLCKLENWEAANRILSLQINTSTSQKLLEQLRIWGYYFEQISLCQELLGKLNTKSDLRLLSCLGNAAYIRGNYNLAIAYLQESLQVANLMDDRNAKGVALNNLGTIYNILGSYSQIIDCYQQALSITREIGNRLEEGYTLGNLGLAYNFLGNYSDPKSVMRSSHR
jgi:tetratricopeptide (TPR) repeat protein